jgi:YcxB-like protein
MRTVTYDLTLDDLEAGWRERAVRRAQLKFAWRQSRWRLILVAVLAAAVGAWVASKSPQASKMPPASIAMMSAGVIAALGALVIASIVIAWKVASSASHTRKLVATGVYGTLAGPHAVELREGALVVRQPSGEHQYAWSAIQRCEQGESGVLLFLGPLRLVCVPNRAFLGGYEKEAFLAECRRHLARSGSGL